ncbi:MAG: cytidylate kinase-like family protein [Patescibacteria group bacterium]|nr:cytidylate kinase-like family protein [Patescibacteria group bacterium]
MTVDVYPFLNKLFNFRQLGKKLGKSHSDDPKLYQYPYITVAREPGSGGRPIAKAVAKELGYEFVDKQIVNEIARSVERRRGIIEEVDEKGRTMMEDIVHSVLNPEYVDNNLYMTELCKIILAYAFKGKVVILGRGANFITPFARGLHVSITAPYAVRVKRAIDYEGFSERKAKRMITKVEKERRDFIMQYIQRDSSKVNSYDLTLNTTSYEVDEARDVIIKAFYKKFSHTLKEPKFHF